MGSLNTAFNTFHAQAATRPVGSANDDAYTDMVEMMRRKLRDMNQTSSRAAAVQDHVKEDQKFSFRSFMAEAHY